jgi:hypothetical protein
MKHQTFKIEGFQEKLRITATLHMDVVKFILEEKDGDFMWNPCLEKTFKVDVDEEFNLDDKIKIIMQEYVRLKAIEENIDKEIFSYDKDSTIDLTEWLKSFGEVE